MTKFDTLHDAKITASINNGGEPLVNGVDNSLILRKIIISILIGREALLKRYSRN